MHSCTTTGYGLLEIWTCLDTVSCGILRKVHVNELVSAFSISVFLHMILFQCGQTPQYPGQDGNSLIQTWKAGVTILIRWQYPRRWCIGLQAAVTGVNHRHIELSSVLPCIKRSKGPSGSSITTLCTVQPPAMSLLSGRCITTEVYLAAAGILVFRLDICLLPFFPVLYSTRSTCGYSPTTCAML